MEMEMQMKQVMNHNKDNGLLNMIRRLLHTEPYDQQTVPQAQICAHMPTEVTL